MRVQQVWLAGGPADGRILAVEAAWDGHLPGELVLDQAGAFIGTGDQPTPAVQHRYRRTDDSDGIPVYRHLES